MRFFLFILLSILFTSPVSAEEANPVYHKVPAKDGDGVYALLRRYDLDGYECNFDKFYEINKLKEGQGLYKNRKYLIPVLIYTYNGKSIRSTIGIENWDKAVRIQQYNHKRKKDGHRKKTYQSSKVLWVPFHELDCVDEDFVAEGDDENVQVFPIFGDAYKKVKIKANTLKGEIYYIVGGHGGPDPGAQGEHKGHTLCEDEYAYDVSLRLARKLIENGATVYIITEDKNDGIRDDAYLDCDKDERTYGDLKMPVNQKKRLTIRADAVDKLYDKHKKAGAKVQKMVSIHIDSRAKSKRADVFFYYCPGSKAGKKLAKNMHATMKAKYKKYRAKRGYHGTVRGRGLFMLTETKPTAVYVELGNIRNKQDQLRFILKSNRIALAKWLYEGLIE